MNLGETIERIRKSKNIPIKVLIHGVISRSQYHKVVRNKSQVSAITFLALLENLNVTLEEFMYIHNEYKPEMYKQMYIEIRNSFTSNDVEGLKEIQIWADKEYRNTQIEKYQHIVAMIDILIARLELREVNPSTHYILKDYLMNLEAFTHYDLVIYSNIIFTFSREMNKAIFKRLKKSHDIYQNLNTSESEYCKIISNLIIVELENKDVEQASMYINMLLKIEFANENLLEKIIQGFFKAIQNIFQEKHSEGTEEILGYLNMLKKLECTYYYVFQNIADFYLKDKK